jgi:phosphoserine phosphatase
MKSLRKLVVFDMDGVLVDVDSSWSYVHNALKVGKNDNLGSYLAGRIDYRELIRRDVMLWGRVHISTMKRILGDIQIMKGAERAITQLRKGGCKTAIISAGIAILANRLQKTLGIDYSYANELEVDREGFLTGEGIKVVPLFGKVGILRKLASECKTSLDDCVAIGDSRYDIPVFEEVGFSIAFNSSDAEVEQEADAVVEGKDLSKIVPLILGKQC